MAVSLSLKASQDRYYGNWVRRGRRAFMRSEAYEILAEAMRRYLRQESSGLSFLIGGHRGAGKTALVTEVVEAISDDLFEAWDIWAAESPANPVLSPPPERQRPLLVKLHGPSLIGKELPSPGGGEEPNKKEANKVPIAKTIRNRNAATVVELNVNQSPATPAREDSDTRTAATGRAQAALVQIMIGLYRALAREVGEAAAARALDLDESDDREYGRESAAQLRLELDRMAGPEMLRDLWDDIAPDRYGIFWPRRISETLAKSLVPDQHFREIIAVATAAQAFQVCSGAITYNQTRKETASQERSIERKTSFDTKDIANRLAALGIGGLIGYGIAGSLGAGLGLLGSLGVSTMSRRATTRERGEDYTFIVDRSVQTLERDLPLVIERVRAAGLAPIFVVDELDKLPHTGDGNVADIVRDLINQLKSLTTDHGFFCFLTGRDYFDDIKQALAKKAYPVEHTFFSERLLIAYGPDDFYNYTSQILTCNEEGEDFLARYLLSKALILDSQLNTIDLLRRLRRGWDQSGAYRMMSWQLAGSNRHLLAAALQLSIEYVLRGERVGERTIDDPGFRQVAFDALYRVARLWEHGKHGIDISRPAIAQDLLARPDDIEYALNEAEAAAVADMGPVDFDLLCEIVQELTGYLCDFETVFSRISDTGRPDKPYAMNQEISVSLRARHFRGLLERDGDGTNYRYLFRRDGTDRFSSVQFDRVRRSVDTSKACLRMLGEVGIALSDLGVIGWPSTINQEMVTDAIAKLDRIIGAGDRLAAGSEVAPLDEFLQALENHRRAIGNAISLAAGIFREAELTPPAHLPQIMATFPRFLVDPPRILAARSLRTEIEMKGEGAQHELEDSYGSDFPITDEKYPVQTWPQDILNKCHNSIRAVPLEMRNRRAWLWWLTPISNFIKLLETGVPTIERKPQLNDLVLNAARRLPSRLLSHELLAQQHLDHTSIKIDRFAWTEMALASIASQWPRPNRAQPAEYAPAWAAVAALRILGFGRDAAETLLSHLKLTDPHTEAKPTSFLPPSGEFGSGVLVVSTRAFDRPSTSPYILITPDMFDTYNPEIVWLAQIGLLTAGVWERG
jgi:hypothetical protein